MSMVCKCDPDTWDLELLKVSPICNAYEETDAGIDICCVCSHDKQCHEVKEPKDVKNE